jgi:hypothetical protein
MKCGFTSRCSNRSVSTTIEPSGASSLWFIAGIRNVSCLPQMLHHRPHLQRPLGKPTEPGGAVVAPQVACLRNSANRAGICMGPLDSGTLEIHSSHSTANAGRQIDWVSNVKLHIPILQHARRPRPIPQPRQFRSQALYRIPHRPCTHGSICPQRRSCLPDCECSW